MKYRILFVAIFFAMDGFVQAQNLVLNPGFDAYTVCPTGLSQFNGYVESWTNPTISSPDYFNACSNPNLNGVPSNNAGGYQAARSGNAYGGLYAASGAYREYMQVKLASPLIIGHKYEVSFYTCLHNKARWATNDLGAYLTTYALSMFGTSLFPGNPIPQVNNVFGNVITDTLNWKQITGNFIAAGGEQYITIGHFNTDALSTYLQVNYGTFGSYYYIDDVSIIDVTPLPVELCLFTAKNLDKSVKLNWQTKSELNNSFFEVQRSSGNLIFESIYQMAGHGTTSILNNYEYLDINPGKNQVCYYRLKQVDYDGKFSYSEIISVYIKPSFNIFPNPISDMLYISCDDRSIFEIEILDYRGLIVRRLEGLDSETAVNVEDLKKGIYYLIISTNQNRKILKLVK